MDTFHRTPGLLNAGFQIGQPLDWIWTLFVAVGTMARVDKFRPAQQNSPTWQNLDWAEFFDVSAIYTNYGEISFYSSRLIAIVTEGLVCVAISPSATTFAVFIHPLEQLAYLCLLIFSHPPSWPTSATNWRHICSANHFAVNHRTLLPAVVMATSHSYGNGQNLTPTKSKPLKRLR